MKFLTDEKLTIMGAAGMIGSNMAQTALMMGLTTEICLYDPYGDGLEGVAEEMYHCGFEGVNITYTTDIAKALTGAAYIVNSGGAARKAGMTREDLLKGNAEIACQFGKDIRSYCPDVKHVVVVFNPADITGLVTLVYSGLPVERVSTLAALDSTRLRTELAKFFKLPVEKIRNCRTYGGHGEQMAVYASTTWVNDTELNRLIGTKELPVPSWEEIKELVVKGGANIIRLRGRSSFQSPAYLSVQMIAAAMGYHHFTWPSGVYVNEGEFAHIMMAMESVIDRSGVHFVIPKGDANEQLALKHSYEHLCKLRDEVIAMGILPPIAEWGKFNSHM